MLFRKTSRLTKVFIGILSILIIFGVSYYFATISKTTVEKMSNLSDYIDVAYYINLDHRTDRKEELLGELEKIDFPAEKIERIPAIYMKEKGHLGCSFSHIKTVETFLQSNYQTCFILEDDFEFSQSPEEVKSTIQKLFDSNVDFDLCMLSANVHDEEPIPGYDFIQKINSAATSAGFILTRKFAPILLANLKEGAKKLENSYNERTYITNISKHDPDRFNYDGQYSLDHYWIYIQKENNWFIFEPKLGKQRNSYSDIMEGNVAYNV